MTETELIIDRIERFYSHYLGYESESTFNRNTDTFFMNLRSIGVVDAIFRQLVEEFLFTNECFSNKIYNKDYPIVHRLLNAFEYRKYISFCIQYYYYLKGTCLCGQPYFSRSIWIRPDIHGQQPLSVRLFKTDFVRPIVDFIINSLSDDLYIHESIIKYQQRVEIYRQMPEGRLESDWQRHLSLYLFDKGVDHYREANLGNGKIDFYIEDNNKTRSHWGKDAPKYVIETKVFKKDQQQNIKNGVNQLHDYLRRISAHGCLVVFTDVPLDIRFNHEGIEVIQIYIGEKSSSVLPKPIVLE